MDDALRELERLTRTAPGDQAAQLRYAHALGRAGERDAWGRELADLVSDGVAEARAALFGTDEGLRWALDAIAGRELLAAGARVLGAPASEEAIAAAEARIGFRLPDLLRRLYRVANGVVVPGPTDSIGFGHDLLRPVELLVPLEVGPELREAVPEFATGAPVVFAPSWGLALVGSASVLLNLGLDGGGIAEVDVAARSFEEWFEGETVLRVIGKKVRRPEEPFAIKGLDEAFPGELRVEPGELRGAAALAPRPDVEQPPARSRARRRPPVITPLGQGDGSALEVARALLRSTTSRLVDFDAFATALGQQLAVLGHARLDPPPPTHPVSLRAAWCKGRVGRIEAVAVVPFTAATSGDPAEFVRRAAVAVAPAFSRWRLVLRLELDLVLVGHGALPLEASVLSRAVAAAAEGERPVRGLHFLDLDTGAWASPTVSPVAFAFQVAVQEV